MTFLLHVTTSQLTNNEICMIMIYSDLYCNRNILFFTITTLQETGARRDVIECVCKQ